MTNVEFIDAIGNVLEVGEYVFIPSKHPTASYRIVSLHKDGLYFQRHRILVARPEWDADYQRSTFENYESRDCLSCKVKNFTDKSLELSILSLVNMGYFDSCVVRFLFDLMREQSYEICKTLAETNQVFLESIKDKEIRDLLRIMVRA